MSIFRVGSSHEGWKLEYRSFIWRVGMVLESQWSIMAVIHQYLLGLFIIIERIWLITDPFIFYSDIRGLSSTGNWPKAYHASSLTQTGICFQQILKLVTISLIQHFRDRNQPRLTAIQIPPLHHTTRINHSGSM
jgi:hypothetical protein